MREDVDQARLLHFLRELGRTYRGRARLRLCGGESFVLRGLRQSTRDVDLDIEVEPGDHGRLIEALRKLKRRLDINVEEAKPTDFVPEPPGARNRDEFVDRFGGVDVFLCDPYSIALAKLDRGAKRDLLDVSSLLEAAVVDRDRLRELIERAITEDRRPLLRFDPERVRRNLAHVLRRA